MATWSCNNAALRASKLCKNIVLFMFKSKATETYLENAHTTKTRVYKPVSKSMSNTHFLYTPLYTLKGYHFINFYGLPRNNKNIYIHLCDLRSSLKWFSKRFTTVLRCFRKHFETVAITLKSVEVSILIPIVFWLGQKRQNTVLGYKKGSKSKSENSGRYATPTLHIAVSFIYPNIV